MCSFPGSVVEKSNRVELTVGASDVVKEREITIVPVMENKPKISLSLNLAPGLENRIANSAPCRYANVMEVILLCDAVPSVRWLATPFSLLQSHFER